MYKRILVPIDGSVAADAGLREAIKLASARRGATIRLLHVLEPLPALQGMEMVITGPLLKNMTTFGKKILENAKALAKRNGIRAETMFQNRSQKRAADGILREARELGAGPHRDGHKRPAWTQPSGSGKRHGNGCARRHRAHPAGPCSGAAF